MNFAEQISRFLEPLRTRVRMIVQRAIVSLVNDTTAMQLIQVSILRGDVLSRVERVQNYGFTSNPENGSEAVVVFINGNRDQGLAIVVDNTEVRKKDLQPGEVAVYHKSGSYVLMKADGTIELSDTPLTPLAGVVTGECLCAFTGAPHPDKSSKVFAKKV